jgi:hypothetical protein
MTEPPDLRKPPASAREDHGYDFDQASRILAAMDFLRGEAKETRIDEIVTMIDASFRILVTTYYCILRYEMAKLPGTDMVQ